MAESWLDAITFETFGWQLVSNSAERVWMGDGHTSLVERFIPEPQDLDVWDPEEIRAGLSETQALVDAGDERIMEKIMDIDFSSDEMKAAILRERPEQLAVIELNLFELGSAKCVDTINRHRRGGEIHYSSAIQIFFRECFWVLGVEMHDDDELVGEREGAVAREMLKVQEPGQRMEAFEPYDRRWHGLVRVEHDPLTRIRSLTATLKASVRLGPRTTELTPIPSAD